MAEPKSSAMHSPKSLSSFLCKAFLFAVIISLLPLFSPQPFESKNPTFFARTWELLRLLLAGIAISYGLFGRRNSDPNFDKDKEKDAAFTIPLISSAFDEEESKAEAWSSQYHRPGPIVVETKPLLLPVRSLKNSRVHNSDSSWPPPPPPPPPPPFSHGSLIATRREVKKSFKDELKDLSINDETKKKKKVEFSEKMIVISDDSESEKGSDSTDAEKDVNENEVDKKADEFIAKFREQIRLQRIESIKKCSGHRAVKNTK